MKHFGQLSSKLNEMRVFLLFFLTIVTHLEAVERVQRACDRVTAICASGKVTEKPRDVVELKSSGKKAPSVATVERPKDSFELAANSPIRAAFLGLGFTDADLKGGSLPTLDEAQKRFDRQMSVINREHEEAKGDTEDQAAAIASMRELRRHFDFLRGSIYSNQK